MTKNIIKITIKHQARDILDYGMYYYPEFISVLVKEYMKSQWTPKHFNAEKYKKSKDNTKQMKGGMKQNGTTKNNI